MRIAVAGGTGVVGRHTVDAVQRAGHEAVVLSRAAGVDLVSARGLDAALAGADAVIDVANITTVKATEAVEFFTAATGNLITAAADAGVAHVVLLSIVGIDRMPVDYYAGKLAQEKIVETSAVPWTIQRATQFHEFAGQIYDRAKLGPLHLALRARTQPVAARDVAERLTALATGPAQGRARDLAGPREEALDDMIIAFARANGHHGWIPRVSMPTAQMKGMRAGLALPGPDAELTTQTFADWLGQR
ncbi:SDR family oxidoreductase [Microbacterium sp. NPDC056234]|uniref:SDR family oxidoreductase n=1 Tax=Microbacterium sp. NPDC056234 TaxID=3345757 RepID=UPI0035DBECDF